jgi:hypothetical protein
LIENKPGEVLAFALGFGSKFVKSAEGTTELPLDPLLQAFVVEVVSLVTRHLHYFVVFVIVFKADAALRVL